MAGEPGPVLGHAGRLAQAPPAGLVVPGRSLCLEERWQPWLVSPPPPPGNHSCIPNAETSFPDNNFLLHLTALEDIEAGEVRGVHVAETWGEGAPRQRPPCPPRTPALYLWRCPGAGRFPGCGELEPYSAWAPPDPTFPRGFRGDRYNLCCFGFLGSGSQPGPFLFARRKSASVTWTAVRGSGADTAATRYSGRGCLEGQTPPPHHS